MALVADYLKLVLSYYSGVKINKHFITEGKTV
jgi:hypothetical protein